MPVKFIGMDEFSQEEIGVIKELIGHHLKKIRRREIDKFDLIVHAKKHFKSGKPDKAVKYSLVARLDAPDFLIAAKAADWNVRKVCHEAMVKLENEFNHKFRADSSYKKSYLRR